MSQVPAGQSQDPYEYDRFALDIPVMSDDVAASEVHGTALGCLDPAGALAVASHNLMVCATDARDLETVHCWFCGPDLGGPSLPEPDTVGRVSSAPGPGGASFVVTNTVSCAYGQAAD